MITYLEPLAWGTIEYYRAVRTADADDIQSLQPIQEVCIVCGVVMYTTHVWYVHKMCVLGVWCGHVHNTCALCVFFTHACVYLVTCICMSYVLHHHIPPTQLLTSTHTHIYSPPHTPIHTHPLTYTHTISPETASAQLPASKQW